MKARRPSRGRPSVDKSQLAIGVRTAVDDREYLDWLRDQPCILTGQRGNAWCSVVPMHIGTHGKSIKSDDEALPARADLHSEGHQSGEISMLRKMLPDDVLRNALRAYARERYREWKNA